MGKISSAFLLLIFVQILASARSQQNQRALSRSNPQKNYFPQVPYYPQLPQFPQVPQFPQFPQVPQFPQIPSIPQIPSVPQIPSLPQLPQFPHIPTPSYGQVLDATLDIIKKTQQFLNHPKR